METIDKISGLTDKQAYALIRAEGRGDLFALADKMGIDRRAAYNFALGRSVYRAQWLRCVSNPRELE
jgi:hypothetical protein